MNKSLLIIWIIAVAVRFYHVSESNAGLIELTHRISDAVNVKLFAIVTSYLVVLMQLVQGPHFENI